MTHDEIIAVITAHKEGKKIQYSRKCAPNFYDLTDDPVWNFEGVDYRIKPTGLTREEITAKWVKDNDVKVGDKLGIKGRKVLGRVDDIGISILLDLGEYCDTFTPEQLYVPKFQKFTFEDRELFRGKWVRCKGCDDEYLIVSIGKEVICIAGSEGIHAQNYTHMFARMEFIDGEPFGKEIWK